MKALRLIQASWFPLVTGLIYRLININSPLVGIHSWRQADTSSMARHFALQNTPIWLPQVDWAGASPGYVECEFPLFPYLVGQLYKLTGIHESIGRGLSIIFSLLTILCVINIGEKLFSFRSGWWGGLFFAICPIGVYYGRTFQGESLMLFLSALSLIMLIDWIDCKNKFYLIISWTSFTLAALIKVLPFIWIGLPLLLVASIKEQIKHKKLSLYRQQIFNHYLLNPWIFVYAASSLLIIFGWYFYSYQLGQVSGNSFGFWGNSSDRASISMLTDINLWLNLFLRISIRNLGLLGLPLLLLGIFKSFKSHNGQILLAGLLGVFICTTFAFRASSIHEYYQLPIQIFACPLMGQGVVEIVNNTKRSLFQKSLFKITLCLIFTTSLIVLSIDYWAVESAQAKIWMPLAQRIRKDVPIKDRIISVTGADPTLLNLARRQGWLTDFKGVNKEQLEKWYKEGATHIAGSLEWQESHVYINDKDLKNQLENILCKKIDMKKCIIGKNKIYLLPIQEII